MSYAARSKQRQIGDSIHQELVKLGLPVKLASVEGLVAGYFSKFAARIQAWKNYSSGSAKAYFLNVNGRLYDSKAIAGADRFVDATA